MEFSNKFVGNATEMTNLKAKPHYGIICRKPGTIGFRQLWAAGGIGVFMLLLAGCGGGISSSTSTTKNPVPTISAISPASAFAGSQPLTMTVTGSNFISSSVVNWKGVSRTTTYISSSQLSAAITGDDLAAAGTAAVTVFNPTPGGGTSGSLSFTINSASTLSVLTTRLPDASHSKTYSYALQAGGGLSPYTWSVAAGSLPSGLSLSSAGVISGTPPTVTSDSTSSFTVQVSDSAFRANTATQPTGILVRAAGLGRNETCSTATSISNGVTRASISPYGDIDVYSFHGTAGNRVTIEIYAQRLTLYSGSTTTDDFLDSFLELLNSSCSDLTYNDDINPGVNRDSLISSFALPYTGTYYIRVSDLSGNGRPDFIYELHLTGAD
jgi:hypothetical protein